MSFLAAPPSAPPITIDPTKARLVAQWKHGSPLLGCRVDPAGKYVFAGAQDNAVARWEIATGKKTTFAGHTSWIRALAFARPGVWGRSAPNATEGLLFSGDWAGRLFAWPVESDNPSPQWSLTAHRGWVRALATSPDGRTLASCGNDNHVKLWSIPDGKPIATFAGHDCHVYNIAFHPDGRSLVSADLKGGIKVWDVRQGAVTRELDAKVLHKYDGGFMADIGGIRGMVFDAEGKYLACAGITNVSNAFAGVGNPLIVLFDWASGKQKLQMKPKAAFQGTAWGVAFHPQGFLLGVGAGNGGALWAWKPNEALAFHTMTLPNSPRDLALHPDGRRLAIPSYDGVLRVYELATKK